MVESVERPRYQSVLERYPKHVHAIGMISIEIANLDILLGEMLGGLLRISRVYSRIVYLTPRSNFGRLELIENAAEAMLQPDSIGLKHVKSLIGRARAIAGKRHDLIHHAWVLVEDSDQPHQSIMLTDPPIAKPVEITTLENIVRDIRELVLDVIDATEHLYADAREAERRYRASEQSERSSDQKD